MTLNDKLTFGKYKGMTVEEAIAKDAQYLQWAEERAIIELDDDALEAVTEGVAVQYAEWLREYGEDEQQTEY